tara:strand:- start:1388 stop:1594 length:207 start_codon:yes stop_codon:yes gene_type:complete
MKRNDLIACRTGCELSATYLIFTRSVVKGNCARMNIYHTILSRLLELFDGWRCLEKALIENLQLNLAQ